MSDGQDGGAVGATASAEAPPYARGIAYVGDSFLAAAEARVSIFDHSFLYGDGAFESIVFRHGRLYALEPHLDRLDGSCAYLNLELPLGRERMREVCAELIERNGVDDGYLRIVVSRGEGYPLSDPRRTEGAVLAITVQGEPPTAGMPAGRRLAVVATRRTPPDSLDPRAKLNNYGNHVIAKLEAIAAGADDAIMLDQGGGVAELPGCNVFVVRDGELATPAAGNILLGITRATVLKLARAGKVEGVETVSERVVSPLELYAADEALVTGTGTGIAHVAEVDGRRIGGAEPGPVARRLIELYEDVLERGLAFEDLGA
jgi:branched-chain amino acid aminotransferase